MEVQSRKREGKRLYARAQKWSCQTCLFLDSWKPIFELLRNCFSFASESKNGHACRKNGCPPRVHFQATNVNAISVPNGKIVRRPTRIDTSMQSVDASCSKQHFKKTARNCSRYLVDWKSKWLAKGLEKSLNEAAMEVQSRKREGKRLYARAQKWSCQTCLFLDSWKPIFELLRNCFSFASESKNGHACRKNGCPPRVHFQATNVNAISVPNGKIVRRPTRIDTSMQSVDASCSKQHFKKTARNYGGHFIEASIGMVFQVCFWERRKLQLVAAFASKAVVVRYSVASWGIVEAQTSRSDICMVGSQDFEI